MIELWTMAQVATKLGIGRLTDHGWKFTAEEIEQLWRSNWRVGRSRKGYPTPD